MKLGRAFTKRRLLFFIAAATLVAAVSGLLGTGWAWVKGEAFYRGRSASYWGRELLRWQETEDEVNGCREPLWYRPAAPWEGWVSRHVSRLEDWLPDTPPILEGDPQALSVLQSLLEDPSPRVRRMAAHGLGRLEEHGRPAVPELLKRLNDADLQVRDEVEDALFLTAPEVAEARVVRSERYNSRCLPKRSTKNTAPLLLRDVWTPLPWRPRDHVARPVNRSFAVARDHQVFAEAP